MGNLIKRGKSAKAVQSQSAWNAGQVAAVCKDGVCTIGDRPMIEVRDLNLKYGDRQVLADIQFNSPSCAVTAIIGPSGSGKSSFLNCLNRLTDVIPGCCVTGSIRVNGTEIIHGSAGGDCISLEHLRQQVGMVFQKPNPFPLSIAKNLLMPLKHHGVKSSKERHQRMEQALKEVGLWDDVRDRLDESALLLSGGQQQRLCIARALVLQPQVVLLDEPCSSLDPQATRRIEELIVKLRSQYTFVIVTHNLAQARRIADVTAVFWADDGVGKIVDQGETERVFAAPASQTATAYLSGHIG